MGHVAMRQSAEAFVHVVRRLGSRVGDVIREGVQVDLAQLRLRGLRVVAQLLVHRLRGVRPHGWRLRPHGSRLTNIGQLSIIQGGLVLEEKVMLNVLWALIVAPL